MCLLIRVKRALWKGVISDRFLVYRCFAISLITSGWAFSNVSGFRLKAYGLRLTVYGAEELVR